MKVGSFLLCRKCKKLTEQGLLLHSKDKNACERKRCAMANKVTHPILFQGDLKKQGPYFEGWYFKSVSTDEKTVLSLIPGISLTAEDPHCFIQYSYVHVGEGPGKELRTGYIRYPLSAFQYNQTPFVLKVGNSVFSETLVSVHLEEDDFRMEGILKLGPFQAIKRTPLSPSIMGFFAYIPNMECYHGVISMNHAVDGTVAFGTKACDFTGGKGYLEKDWGTSFPEEYVWIQCNHFRDEGTSLFFSVAKIPYRGSSFEGFICNFIVDGIEYRFATYNRSKFTLGLLTDDRIEIEVSHASASLTICAEVLHGGALMAPTRQGMDKLIKEGLSGIVTVDFTDQKTGKIYHDVGNVSGIEVVR